MVRRWVVTILVAAALVAMAVVAARAIRDDPGSSSSATGSPPESVVSTTVAVGSSTLPNTTGHAPSTTTAGATTTSGVPGPCGVDTGPIRSAIDAGVTNAAAAEVAGCRLAASDPSWASVQLAAKPGAQFDTLTVIVHRGGGSWAVVATGGTNAGCGRAPQAVIVDLGQFCAGTGGGGA